MCHFETDEISKKSVISTDNTLVKEKLTHLLLILRYPYIFKNL